MDEFIEEIMEIRKQELLDHLAEHIRLTIAALYYADDRGSIDHWVQRFLEEQFHAEFDGV